MLKSLFRRQFFPALFATAALVFAGTVYLSHVDKDAHGAGSKHCEVCLTLGSTPTIPATPAMIAAPVALALIVADQPRLVSPAARRIAAHRSRAPPSLV